MRIRVPLAKELPALSALCFRSKAVWGYDRAFMAACREELTLRPEALLATHIAVAEDGDGVAGVVQVSANGDQAELLKLFVEPARLRHGAGRLLFDWAVETAWRLGARTLVVEADPDAASFYRRMGARDIGFTPSGSIPGRLMPKLAYGL